MAVPPPSQFAALLRQSKFASFDPQIGQAYASFGGHAHRGNWGLKRPLPLRRRNGTVTVRAVDSREQQTEWKSAEPQSRWIQMWDEVGVTPRLALEGPWSKKLGFLGEVNWKVDSEFSRGADDLFRDDGGVEDELGKKDKSMATPNIYAMTEKEFGRYLKQLREMRPAFREHIQESERTGSSLWEQSHRPGEHFKSFLQRRAYQIYNSSESHEIEQQPQRYGGLTYTKSPPLQTYFLAKPEAGRILQQMAENPSSRLSSDDFIVSFAGMTPTLGKNQRGTVNPVDWKSLDGPSPDRGVTKFRFMKATLVAPPATVGDKPEGLGSVKIYPRVIADTGVEMTRPNTHIPGSREYVANNELAAHTPTLFRSQSRTTTPRKDYDGKVQGKGEDLMHHLMNTMSNIVTR
ncbi:hypothetical protein AcV5_006567 [Taiwanofungus camphoratus]|nr:hypothetical protein AcW2_005007 [Antrodia cinnamomea]KAI0934867.1 hypothetical protein AcV5_006567 [Antrodia cinnamomea]